MKQHGFAVVLIALGVLLASCSRPVDRTPRRSWPGDHYQRPAAVPESPRTQVVFGIAASDKVPYEQLQKKAALVGVELLSVEDSRGGIHLQVTVVHPRRPFVLRLKDGRNKPKLEMGRKGVVHEFESRTVTVRTWGAHRIPKGVGVESIQLFVEGDLAHPTAFERSDRRQKVRWPSKGSIPRFPLYHALVLRLDNARTLIRIGAINKRGRLTSYPYMQVKSANVDKENLGALFRATVERRDRKGLAILR